MSWLVGASAALFSLLLGGTIGTIAAVSGKAVDNTLMRSIDMYWPFPASCSLSYWLRLSDPG